jgi:hypothetical protein
MDTWCHVEHMDGKKRGKWFMQQKVSRRIIEEEESSSSSSGTGADKEGGDWSSLTLTLGFVFRDSCPREAG